MKLPLRWLLILIAWALFAEIYRAEKTLTPPYSGFSDRITGHVPSKLEKPSCQEEIINPDQHLPMVHVASLSTLPDGMIGVVWYGGTAECHPDVKIYFSTRDPSGIWSAPFAIMTCQRVQRDLRRPEKALGNAVLLASPKGSLRLLFVTIAMGKWSGSQLNSSVSDDDGLTWSPAEHLTLSPFFNFSELVRNRPIALQGDGWCVPIYQEFLGKFPELLWLKETDGKLTARKIRIAGGCSSFQPSLIPLDDRRALVLLRDYTDSKHIFLSRSEDGGLHWSKPVPTNLPNPDAGVSGLLLSGGKLLVAYNDSAMTRENLSLALSSNEGRTWQKIATFENDPHASFSYPYLMRSSDGMIHMAYTWKSKAIKMVSFNEAWLTEQAEQAAKNTER